MVEKLAPKATPTTTETDNLLTPDEIQKKFFEALHSPESIAFIRRYEASKSKDE